METLYRKLPNGRYEPVGMGTDTVLGDGIWVIKTTKISKSYRSVAYLVGEPKEPKDVLTHASLQSLHDKLTDYIMKLQDENSEEYSDAKDVLSGFLRGPLSLYNISPNDLSTMIIRRIAEECELKFEVRTRMFI